VGRAYNCWMLNCWCKKPVGFESFTMSPHVCDLYSTVVSKLSVADKMWHSDDNVYSVVDDPWREERSYLLRNRAEKTWPLHIRDLVHLNKCKEIRFKFLTVKRKTLPNISQVLELGVILWFNTRSGKGTWDFGTWNIDCSGSDSG